ncbi:hypothetical protein EDB89DRAFT_136319 [Lactarius sanguifluus]|nr:hypothetical protein EDB89DRAFT_136319 [Lactarius sanguifluus]
MHVPLQVCDLGFLPSAVAASYAISRVATGHLQREQLPGYATTSFIPCFALLVMPSRVTCHAACHPSGGHAPEACPLRQFFPPDLQKDPHGSEEW